MASTKIVLAINLQRPNNWVDNHFANGLRETIQGRQGLKLAGEATSPMELLLEIERCQPDVVVVANEPDTEVPGVVTHLLNEFPGVFVMVLTKERMSVFRQEIQRDEFFWDDEHDICSQLQQFKTNYWTSHHAS